MKNVWECVPAPLAIFRTAVVPMAVVRIPIQYTLQKYDF